jgi:acyl-CoA synthetase (AMP-forming)/AMP-acid ligase II
MTRIGDYVRHYAATAPDREAVVAGAQRLSYAQLQARIDRCSQALIAAGVGKGDRVAMLDNPSAEFLAVFLAATSIGAIWLGLSPRYRLDEYRYIVGDSQPSVLFAIGAFEGRSYEGDVAALKAEFPCIRTLVRLEEAGGAGMPLEDFLRSGEAVEEAQLERRRGEVARFDPALIVYTSGSSGKPKGAVLSHYGLCFGNAVQGREFGVDVPRAVCPFPINHVACVGDTCCTTFIRGGTLVFMPRFDAAAVLETIERERINLWIGVPTMFILAADLPDFRRRDLSSLQTVVWGGAAMPRDYIETYRRTGARLVTLYGLTEATTDTTFTAPDATLEELADTVGRPAPEYPCRIVREDGSPCAVGEAGEIQFKGEFNMLGYFNRPEATAAAFTADGWLRSGDVGYFRQDGNLVFVARMSEMFKSGGFNVYPREIEEVIEQHPAVALAGVIDVKDALFGEVGEAHVLLRPGCRATGAEIIDFCRARLANYKVPKRVVLRDELPMLPVGKIDKALLRRQAANG